MADVYEGDRPYVFVSYSHVDDETVLPIIEALGSAGYRVWYDEGVEWASEWPENIANHLYACSRFLVFMSRAAAVSDNCGDEIYYALNNRKPMLVAYIDDVELGEVNRGLDMRLAKRQAKRRRDYPSDEAFVGDLLAAKILEPCLRDEYLRRREAKWEALKIAQSALSASGGDEKSLREALMALRSLPEDDWDKSVERFASGIENRLQRLEAERELEEAQRREQDERERREVENLRQAEAATRAAEEAERRRAEEAARKAAEEQRRRKEEAERRRAEAENAREVAVALESVGQDKPTSEARTTPVIGGKRVIPIVVVIVAAAAVVVLVIFVATMVFSKGLSKYSWSELKGIADEIAAANSDAEGIEIAKSYGLVDEYGKLQGDTKSVTLADGTEAYVRIAGFRHDVRAEGGRAGITFEFADVPETHEINPSSTNNGGWEMSRMRKWLSSDFIALLPEDLASGIVEVRKSTNNVGYVTDSNDTSVVTKTEDKIWLLSVSEVYGRVTGSEYSSIYGAEGTQYQLYADQGVSTTLYDFCKKSGASSWWWLRSPHARGSRSFHRVDSDGDWLYWDRADDDGGVSPGFCF